MAARFNVILVAFFFLNRASCRPLATNAGSTASVDGGPSKQQVGTAFLKLGSDTAAAEPTVGDVLPGRYIVVFNQQAATNVAAATAALRRHVQQSMAAAAAAPSAATAAAAAGVATAAAAGTPAEFDLQVLGSIGGAITPASPATATSVVTTAAAGSDSSSTSASSNTGAGGIVVSASSAIIEHIKGSGDVATVFQDRVVAAQAKYCLRSSSLAGGITAQLKKDFKWDGCYTTDTTLVWTAQACGKNGDKVLYTELRAISTKTGLLLRAKDGTECVIRPDPKRQYWTLHRFGSGCGIAPLYADLPAIICSSSTRGLTPYTSPAANSQTGTAATDGLGEPATDGQTSPTPEPQQQSPSPEPQNLPSPKPQSLPRIPVAEGEQVPQGVLRIEAATADGVPNTAGLPVEQQVIVAVVDSGVDATHPDINYAGGISFLASSSDPSYDGYGHGTHCAGIIGAKNNGQGVVGVSPGVPIYSLRVLDNKGMGSLSSVLSAIKWAATEGIQKGIKVINLSLATYISPTSPDYQDTYNTVCGVFEEAADAGLLITVAAGNYNAGLPGYLPASCPGSVVAVAAIDKQAAASFSNWLPESSVGASSSPMVLAAPGVDVLSTLPFNVEPSGYGAMSGTSMAAPHVAGVAANCIMSGACAAGTTSLDKLAILQAAAKDRLSMAGAPAYGFKGDATSTINGKYFGYLVSGAF